MNMNLHNPILNGKSALVTGSTSGIGLGIARALAQAGRGLLGGGGCSGAATLWPGLSHSSE